jgi:hypothetical protein
MSLTRLPWPPHAASIAYASECTIHHACSCAASIKSSHCSRPCTPDHSASTIRLCTQGGSASQERTRVLPLAPAGGSELHRPLCFAGSLSMACIGVCCCCWLGSPTASRWFGLGLGGAPSCACGQSARGSAWFCQPASKAQSKTACFTAAIAGECGDAWASLRPGQASTAAQRAVHAATASKC